MKELINVKIVKIKKGKGTGKEATALTTLNSHVLLGVKVYSERQAMHLVSEHIWQDSIIEQFSDKHTPFD